MYVGQHILRSLGDLADIDHRQQALKSLVGRRHKRLHESLDERIRRARRDGEDSGLTREEWARIHEQELVQMQQQIADLQVEIDHVREQRTDLKRMMARAKRLKAGQPSRSRRPT